MNEKLAKKCAGLRRHDQYMRRKGPFVEALVRHDEWVVTWIANCYYLCTGEGHIWNI